jgi:DNA-binding XRE family transcriptional regulator
MDTQKRKRLEAKGWKLGNADEFLGLTKAESEYIEMKMALSKALAELRKQKSITQKALAEMLNTSQTQISKLENGDPSVSIDLLFRSLLALDTPKKTLAQIITQTAL